ncbi:hypothetical protein J5N97_009623 [Dioscorea zingiberensis]|uniref:Uncharacterized protein n=1 Tax=Dioscorea zingiberensis TaxID=325984 RepID=A0A9D5CZQ6_9LILI|nr:hypothetical protein J5N97_009623 [Dioscorea zingiberensis]
MYVTRPLSLYNSNPNASSAPPPEGPGSGVLVMWDEAAEAEAMSCWGLCKDTRLYKLPFLQNRKTEIRYTTGSGDDQRTTYDEVYFIPVVDQPLSSNLYYAIKADGRHRGKAATCSREEDMGTCLCFNFVNDTKPFAFDPTNIYQQVEIIPRGHGRFTAKAVASDGFPPDFLRRKGWRAYASVPKSFVFEGEASGIDMQLRSRMPGLDSPPAVVGKWYSPFIFIKEGDRLKDQMKKSMYYEITLQQFWEEIYVCGKSSTTLSSNGENKVKVSTSVRRQVALLNGNESVEDDVMVVDEFMWFKAVNSMENGFGLSMVVCERMRWEENRFGWLNGMENVVRVERVEENEVDGWKRFSCFVLVERFVFKRMDGSLAFTIDFKHVDKIRAKWE